MTVLGIVILMALLPSHGVCCEEANTILAQGRKILASTLSNSQPRAKTDPRISVSELSAASTNEIEQTALRERRGNYVSYNERPDD